MFRCGIMRRPRARTSKTTVQVARAGSLPASVERGAMICDPSGLTGGDDYDGAIITPCRAACQWSSSASRAIFRRRLGKQSSRATAHQLCQHTVRATGTRAGRG
jgi:hypothetical protein